MSQFDLVIRGGTILDGTGLPAYSGDIGVIDDKIVAIGDLSKDAANSSIDAFNKRVAPGFIDIHTHSDLSVVFHPGQESIISQGITTQIVGNCSLCIGFATKDAIFAMEKRWLAAQNAKITWSNLEEHLQYVEEHGVATNYVMLAGQGTLRKRVMGMAERKPDAGEMSQMKSLLHDAFESGVWGLSTGLEYTPSKFADIPELAELAAVGKQYGGIYASHLRNEGDFLIESVEEALEIGRRSGVAVQLSHHKAEGKANWGKVNSTLRIVEAARVEGIDVQLDQYPYTAFQTSMAVQFLPQWINSGDNETIVSRLSDPIERQKVVDDVLINHADWADIEPGCYWDSVQIGVSRIDRTLQGRRLATIARERNQNPIETMIDIIIVEKNNIGAVNFAINEADIETVMQHPYTMIGSDAVGTAPHGKLGEDRVHPRSYGTFPRVLGHYVRERHVIEEALAIRKMTGLPAERMGLVGRGNISIGNFADIVIYDPHTVGDMATFEKCHQFSVGIEHVLVNGITAWTSGAPSGNLAGRVLRKNH